MITADQLSGVSFGSIEATREFAVEALAIEAARKDFERTGDAASFWHSMSAFGFDADEIEAAIADPTARPASLYC